MRLLDVSILLVECSEQIPIRIDSIEFALAISDHRQDRRMAIPLTLFLGATRMFTVGPIRIGLRQLQCQWISVPWPQ